MTQPMPGKPAEDAENELDIRGLFRTLWAGKLWIIGMGLAFALIALAYTFFADGADFRSQTDRFAIGQSILISFFASNSQRIFHIEFCKNHIRYLTSMCGEKFNQDSFF